MNFGGGISNWKKTNARGGEALIYKGKKGSTIPRTIGVFVESTWSGEVYKNTSRRKMRRGGRVPETNRIKKMRNLHDSGGQYAIEKGCQNKSREKKTGLHL